MPAEARCKCNFCGATLEFTAAESGQITTCPVCKMDTRLYIATPDAKPSTQKSGEQDERTGQSIGEIFIAILSLIFFVVGLLMILTSFLGNRMEAVSENGSAIRQAVYGVYCNAGINASLLGLILWTLNRMRYRKNP